MGSSLPLYLIFGGYLQNISQNMQLNKNYKSKKIMMALSPAEAPTSLKNSQHFHN